MDSNHRFEDELCFNRINLKNLKEQRKKKEQFYLYKLMVHKQTMRTPSAKKGNYKREHKKNPQ